MLGFGSLALPLTLPHVIAYKMLRSQSKGTSLDCGLTAVQAAMLRPT